MNIFMNPVSVQKAKILMTKTFESKSILNSSKDQFMEMMMISKWLKIKPMLGPWNKIT